MSGNLIIGSSHALQFAYAVGDHAATHDGARDDLIAIHSASGVQSTLIYVGARPEFIRFEPADGGAATVSFGARIKDIRKFNSQASKVIFMVGGNEASAYFFPRAPKPYDFFHPEAPQTDPRRQIIPLSIMRAIVKSLVAEGSRTTEALAGQLPQARKYYVSPPPPIPSEDHIRKFPEIFEFEKYGVEDKAVRLKIYRLHMDYMRAFCERQAIEFIDSSTSKTDEHGFLQEEYWDGCTHAAPSYYKDIVEALEL